MTEQPEPERWRRIEELCHEALGRDRNEREPFLRDACGGDESLRREVESLLANHDQSNDLLNTVTPDLIGQHLGIYHITALLGVGGMGEVYRARDTTLGRDVAIKILPKMFTGHEERLARFGREARVLASLNHPNIAAIYGVEESDGLRALVLELVEGQTLDQRLAKGGMQTKEALGLARQIAEALEAAHEKGIVHRDLKPSNVKITPDGMVKVLDFGLAKLETPPESIESSAPDATDRTRVGAIMGTVAYMSPEQARGQAVDKRSDIWAFGCVLFEMLTGTSAFSRGTFSETLVAVLDCEPDWAALPDSTPPAIQRLIKYCLEKHRKERAPDIAVARLELDRAITSTIDPDRRRTPARRSRSRVLLWTGAAVAGALIAAFVALSPWRSTPTDSAAVLRLNVEPPEGTRFNRSIPPVVSPDGTRIVFAALTDNEKSQLWVRRLDSLTATPLAGTENAIYPFWSPDGNSLAFFADGKLKKLSVLGGPATILADASQGRGGTWNADGLIVFAPTIYNGLFQVAASGGAVRPVMHFEPGTPPQKFPWFLPDNRHFLYLFGAGGRDQQTIQLGSIDSPTETQTVLLGVDSGAMYAEGHLLFVRGATLVATPFDPARLKVTGDEVVVAEHLMMRGIPLQSWAFSISTGGVLAYETGTTGARQLIWQARNGTRLEPQKYQGDLGGDVRLSPDQKTVAVQVDDPVNGNEDIWLYDTSRELPTRFTFGPASHGNPVWSPDGRVLVFHSNRRGRFDLYRKSIGGSREELVYQDDLLKNPTSISPDGLNLAYWVFGDPKSRNDIWILPGPLSALRSPKPYRFMSTPFDEEAPEFSPDGRWIAFRSNESGRYQVYVAPFPASEGKKQISIAGGNQPRWRADGHELFYIAPDNRLMAADISMKNGAVDVNKIEPLFGPVSGNFEVSSDGQRFLSLASVGNQTDPPLTIVYNWPRAIQNAK
jgi:serine/threonine protein kinase